MSLLSIILPTFNSNNVIVNALTSIISQSFKNFEVIVIDNVSTDGTVEKVKDLFYNERIHILSEKDSGIYDAMNKGISLAKGEWLYFMGADDVFDNEHVLETVAQNLSDHVDILYGDVMWMPDNIKEEGVWNYQQLLNQNINHQRIFYRRALFPLLGEYKLEYKVAADYELNIRLFCNDSVAKKYIPVTIAHYNSDGFSANKTDEVFYNDWQKIVLENFRKHLPLKIIYKSLGNYCRYLMDKRKYKRALKHVIYIYSHTQSLGFLKLMLNYWIKQLRYAG